MNMRNMKPAISFLMLVVFSALSAGCEDGRSRPPSARVNIIHAAPGFGAIQFLRGPRAVTPDATLLFNGTVALNIDSDSYNYNLQTQSADGTENEDLASFVHTPTPDIRSFYVLVRSGNNVEPLVFSRPAISSDSDNFQFSVIGAASAMPNVDVYFDISGTDISTLSPLGTLGFRQELVPASRAPGNYVLTLTETGNPANVLFTSPVIVTNAGTDTAFVLTTGDTLGLTPYSLVVASSISGRLTDVNAPTAIRIVNGAADQASRDIYLDGDFSTPFAAAVDFAVAAPFRTLAAGLHTFSVTPAGNPSVIESEQEVTLLAAEPYTMLIAGPAGTIESSILVDQLTPELNRARVQFNNTVSYYENLQFFIRQPGTDISNAVPDTVLSSPGLSTRRNATPSDYEVTVRDAATSTVVYGPQAFTFNGEANYTFVMTDSGDGSTAGALLLDDF